ncbi:hypothetical protein BC939DRAFT_453995 [Gamsiella multidivaricata]|uniref:uncharacterized protein n=1 Tax=Gamsiella multidivaricata TaxID=101098 RepID=UPI00221F9AD4|nr:uncharacterized protein BC939DRAFT_453995 [Gamsiella multidivaricata]KAI7822391.1 hypothetical protein BC939DRAFT_453995 [Gamsiella multidivaricata]
MALYRVRREKERESRRFQIAFDSPKNCMKTEPFHVFFIFSRNSAHQHIQTSTSSYDRGHEYRAQLSYIYARFFSRRLIMDRSQVRRDRERE